MKKIFLIFFVTIMAIFIAPLHSFGQIIPPMTDRQLLTELVRQQTEVSKQVAVNNAKIEAMDKRFDDANKRMDMLFYMMLAMLTGIFGLIGFVVWDRQVSIKPILDENKLLAKEIEQLTLRELRHEENVANYFKKIAQIDNRFAGIL